MECPFILPAGSKVSYQTPHLIRAGKQYLVYFPNGWGASVIQHHLSYGGNEGLWELAVLNPKDEISYTHPVSKGDVRGWLTERDVSGLLAEIAATVDPSRN